MLVRVPGLETSGGGLTMRCLMHSAFRRLLGNPEDFVNGRTRALRQLLTTHETSRSSPTRSMLIRAAILPLMALTLMLSVSCVSTAPNPSVPSAPTPPQVTVANAVNALAQAVDGAVTAAIAARDQGKVSQADLNTIESFCNDVAVTGKVIDAELRSPDAWALQKTKILQAVTSASLNTLKGRISPGSQIFVSSLVLLVNQISTVVGGPVI